MLCHSLFLLLLEPRSCFFELSVKHGCWYFGLRVNSKMVFFRKQVYSNCVFLSEHPQLSGSFLRRQLMIANYRVKKFVRKSQHNSSFWLKKLYPKLPLTNCLLIDINYLLPAFSVFSDLDIID